MASPMSTRLSSMLGVAGLIVACLMAASPAAAQWRGQRFNSVDSALRPDFERGDLQPMIKLFDLTEDQQLIVGMYLDEYSRSFSEAAASIRDEIEYRREEVQDDIREMREEGRGRRDFDREMLREFRERMEAVSQPADDFSDGRKIELRDQFFEQLRGTLSRTQADKLPAFERMVNRNRYLPRGLYPSTQVDVIKLANEVERDYGLGPQQAEIEAALQQYAIELDSALLKREAEYSDTEDDLRTAFEERDVDLAEKTISQQIALQMKIRDLHDRYAEIVRQLLPPDATALFDELFRTNSYPQVYRPEPAQETLTAALAIEGLSAETRSAIESIRTQYDLGLADINEKLESAYRRNEPEQLLRTVQRVRAMLNREPMQREDNPIRELTRDRNDLSDKALDDLESLLTEEQWASLPRSTRQRPGRDDDGRFRGGRGFNSDFEDGRRRGRRFDRDDD